MFDGRPRQPQRSVEGAHCVRPSGDFQSQPIPPASAGGCLVVVGFEARRWRTIRLGIASRTAGFPFLIAINLAPHRVRHTTIPGVYATRCVLLKGWIYRSAPETFIFANRVRIFVWRQARKVP
jgi:hypothetical protein